jgi:hypothetical protein
VFKLYECHGTGDVLHNLYEFEVVVDTITVLRAAIVSLCLM